MSTVVVREVRIDSIKLRQEHVKKIIQRHSRILFRHDHAGIKEIRNKSLRLKAISQLRQKLHL